ncbi:MAG: ATP-binding protein, partial [Candidatus Hydrogenedentes bacterium]|nr:ATP-binding protein [Candidatus Hydrogenedentota bacterium]
GSVTFPSVAVPLISYGSLLVRFRTSLIERIGLMAGVILLLLGAGLSVSGFANVASENAYLSLHATRFSHLMGAGSLILGLGVVFYMLARTSEDIEETVERFMYLANHMHEGFILSHVDGPVLMVNKRLLEMFGIAEEEVLGEDVAKLAERFQLHPVSEQLKVRAKHIASEYEVCWNVDGEDRYYWFSGTPVLNRFGSHYANLATVRETTEQRRLAKRVERYAEGLQTLVEEQTQKLQKSEESMRTLLLSMNEGFLTVDGSNLIQFANERFCDLLRLEESALLGKSVLDLVDVAGRVRLLNLLVRREVLPIEEARLELNFLDADGELLPVMAAVTYLQGLADDEEPGHSLVVTGVRDLKQMQHQLEQRAHELELLNEELLMHDRAKDSFLSNVSHELRTPLSTIQGYVEMLESGSLGEMAEPQAAAIRVMDRNVKRLIGHLNEIIEFSRMEIRGVQISRRLFSPAYLVEESVSSFHPDAVARDIELNAVVDEGIVPTWCDREKLGQVLGILLNNALKFTPEGGRIEVRAETDENRLFTLSVVDSGIGIREEHLQKVFEKFFQVDSSKTRRYEGTGIGLSIAKTIAEGHGGYITVASKEGVGTTFTIHLPDAIFDFEWDQSSVGDLCIKEVLMVDEGEAFPAAIQSVLAPLGLTCRLASNGYECVREVEENPPDLILLNDTVNDLAGLNTLALLRQNLATDSIPIIAFSGESAEQMKEAGKLWGDIMFVTKPFTAQDLANALDRVCNHVNIGGDVPDDSLPAVPECLARIMVVDSDPGLLEWVDTAMSHRKVLTYCATTPEQAEELVLEGSPDLVLVDVDVPGVDVLDRLTLGNTGGRDPEMAVYVMTGFPECVNLPSWVAGVLKKPFGTDDLVALIKRHAPDETVSTLSS